MIVPIRTVSGLNAREHYMARARRVKSERQSVAWVMRYCAAPMLPCTVILTRIAPSRGLDSDNLQGALKACRDEVAEWLGVDDAKEDVVKYRYAQTRGQWGVQIEFEALEAA